jgi:hypothetical protein
MLGTKPGALTSCLPLGVGKVIFLRCTALPLGARIALGLGAVFLPVSIGERLGCVPLPLGAGVAVGLGAILLPVSVGERLGCVPLPLSAGVTVGLRPVFLPVGVGERCRACVLWDGDRCREGEEGCADSKDEGDREAHGGVASGLAVVR